MPTTPAGSGRPRQEIEPQHDGEGSPEECGLELVDGLRLGRAVQQARGRRRAPGAAPRDRREVHGRGCAAPVGASSQVRAAAAPAPLADRSSEDSAAASDGRAGHHPRRSSHRPAPATMPSRSATVTGPPPGSARRPASPARRTSAPERGEPHPADDGQHDLPDRGPEGRQVAAVEHEVDGDHGGDHATIRRAWLDVRARCASTRNRSVASARAAAATRLSTSDRRAPWRSDARSSATATWSPAGWPGARRTAAWPRQRFVAQLAPPAPGPRPGSAAGQHGR